MHNTELWECICKHLAPKDLYSLSLTNKYLNDTVKNYTFQHYPEKFYIPMSNVTSFDCVKISKDVIITAASTESGKTLVLLSSLYNNNCLPQKIIRFDNLPTTALAFSEDGKYLAIEIRERNTYLEFSKDKKGVQHSFTCHKNKYYIHVWDVEDIIKNEKLDTPLQSFEIAAPSIKIAWCRNKIITMRHPVTLSYLIFNPQNNTSNKTLFSKIKSLWKQKGAIMDFSQKETNISIITSRYLYHMISQIYTHHYANVMAIAIDNRIILHDFDNMIKREFVIPSFDERYRLISFDINLDNKILLTVIDNGMYSCMVWHYDDNYNLIHINTPLATKRTQFDAKFVVINGVLKIYVYSDYMEKCEPITIFGTVNTTRKNIPYITRKGDFKIAGNYIFRVDTRGVHITDLI